jgi:hypothetical protein
LLAPTVVAGHNPIPLAALADLCTHSVDVAQWVARALGSGPAVAESTTAPSSTGAQSDLGDAAEVANIHGGDDGNRRNAGLSLACAMAAAAFDLDPAQQRFLRAAWAAASPLSTSPVATSATTSATAGSSASREPSAGEEAKNGSLQGMLLLDGCPGSGRTTALLATAVAETLRPFTVDEASAGAGSSAQRSESARRFAGMAGLVVGPRHEALVAAAAALDACLAAGVGGGGTGGGGNESLSLCLSHDDDSRVLAQLHDLVAALALAAPIAAANNPTEAAARGQKATERRSATAPGRGLLGEVAAFVHASSELTAAAKAARASSGDGSRSGGNGTSGGGIGKGGLLGFHRLEQAAAAAGAAARRAVGAAVAHRRMAVFAAAAAASSSSSQGQLGNSLSQR